MKVNLQMTFNSPKIEELFTRLGSYYSSIYTKEAVAYFIQTPDGKKLAEKLIKKKEEKSKK